MGRQVLLVFFGKPRSDSAEHASENPPLITIPLVLLAVLSVFGGALNLPACILLETGWSILSAASTPAEFVLSLAGLALLVALLGLVLAWLYLRAQPAGANRTDSRSVEPEARLGRFFWGCRTKWWVDEFYHAVVVRTFNRLRGFPGQPGRPGRHRCDCLSIGACW